MNLTSRAPGELEMAGWRDAVDRAHVAGGVSAAMNRVDAVVDGLDSVVGYISRCEGLS